MNNTLTAVSVCIVGTNFISDWFAEAAKFTDGVVLGAVYSRKYETGKAFADKHGIKRVYTDYGEMLRDTEISAVYVASPTFCHCEHSLRALRAGKHVLCEKMISVSHDELSLMIDAAKENGVVLLEAMRQDFDPSAALIREYIPRLGAIRRATLEYCQYSSRYDRFKGGTVLNAFDPYMKNSALADIGIYPLHTCVSLFGEPKKIASSSVFLDNGFEGAGTAVLSYDGMTATVIYSKITDSVNPSVIEGELGSLTFDKINAPKSIVYHPRGGDAVRLDYTSVEHNMVYEIQAFRDMIAGGLDHEKYLRVSEITMRCVDKIYECSGISFPEA